MSDFLIVGQALKRINVNISDKQIPAAVAIKSAASTLLATRFGRRYRCTPLLRFQPILKLPFPECWNKKSSAVIVRNKYIHAPVVVDIRSD